MNDDEIIIITEGEQDEEERLLAITEAEETPETEDAAETEPAEDDAQAEETDRKRAKEEQRKRKKARLRQLLNDEDSEGESLRDMLTDLLLSGDWVKRHWKFLLVVFACLLGFVTNRYQAQQEMIEEAKLKKELNEWRYIWLTKFSTLTRSTRQSYIEESLKERGDSTLKLSKEAPFIIKEK